MLDLKTGRRESKAHSRVVRDLVTKARRRDQAETPCRAHEFGNAVPSRLDEAGVADQEDTHLRSAAECRAEVTLKLSRLAAKWGALHLQRPGRKLLRLRGSILLSDFHWYPQIFFNY
jgi:hypothetical protein